MPVPKQLSVENLSNIEKRLSITVPASEIEPEVLDRLHKLAPKVKIAGFRQGRIPFNVLQKRYEPAIRGEVISEKIKESYIAALEQEKFNPVGFPKIDLASEPNAKEDLVYTATFEVYPVINLVDFSQLEVDRVKSEVTEQDVEDTLENIRKQLAKWNEVTDKEYKIKVSDKVKIDFTAKVQCEPPKDEQEKDVQFTIGSGEMWKEFEENVIGKSLGDEVNFNLTFPDSHVDKEVANKAADFTVKINEILTAEFPEINEELAKKCGVKEGGGAEALRAHIKERMEKELITTLKTIFRNNIVTKTVAIQPVDVPKTLVEEEIKRRQERMHQELKTWLKMKDIPMPERERFEEVAKNSVAIGLIFSELARVNNISANEQKVRAKVEEYAKTYHKPEELINWYYSDPKHLAHINAEVFEDEIFAYLEQKAKVTEKSLTHKEVMALRNHQ